MDVEKMTEELTQIFKLYDNVTPGATIKEHIFVYLKVVDRASYGVDNK